MKFYNAVNVYKHILYLQVAMKKIYKILHCLTQKDPLHVRYVTYIIWDSHLGQPAVVKAFIRGGALGQVNISYSGVY